MAIKQFYSMPNDFKTQKTCNDAFEYDIDNLAFIPIEFINQDMCNMATNKSASLIIYVPDKFKTQEMCTYACERNWDTFKFIPDKYKNQRMCNIAFHYNYNDIEYIPNEFKTQKMCDNAFTYYKLLKFIPDKFKTLEMCKEIIKYCPSKSEYIPTIFRTEELWNEINDSRKELFYYLPNLLRKEKMTNYLNKQWDDLNELSDLVMNGKEFNELIKNKNIEFYKLTNLDEVHNGFQFMYGENIDNKLFNPLYNCCEGGIYFTEFKKIHLWRTGHTYKRKVTIPNDDNVWVKIEQDKIKATKLFLGEKEEL